MKGGKIRLDVVVGRKIAEAPKQTSGLIIGTVAEDLSYHVVHLADTYYCNLPFCSSCKAETKSEMDENNDGRPNCHAIFDVITGKIVAYHAQQVVRMLPGGLDILGVFTIDEKNVFSSASELKCKELVSSLTKPLFKHWINDDSEQRFPRIFMHLNPRTKKWNAKCYDSSSMDSRSCDIVEERLSWSRVECEFDTRAAMHVSKADAGAPLKKNLQVLVRAFSESLKSSKILINGQFPSGNQVFGVNACDIGASKLEQDGCAKAWLGSGDCVKHSFSTTNSTVHILLDKEPSILRCETPTDTSVNRGSPDEETLNHLHVKGKITVLAIVPEGSSTAVVAARLREDIMRSIVSRMQMHCESLIDEESTTEPVNAIHVQHEIPRRVFVTTPDSPIVFSDYLFPGDSPQDSISSFLDILAIHVQNEDSIIADKEPPFSYDIQMGEPVEELIMKEGEEINRTIKSFGWSHWVIAGMIMLVLAVAIGLALNKKN